MNSAHQIFQRTANGWTPEPGAATTISEGANGSVWVLGTNTVGGGHGIYRWTGGGWATQPGGAVTIAVGPTGSPWILNTADRDLRVERDRLEPPNRSRDRYQRG